MPLTTHHLNCGTMTPLTGRLVDHCLLIETEDGLVLVDSGFGLRDIEAPRERLGLGLKVFTRPALDPAETAFEQVRALGHDPADVRHIVLTHLDGDHAGGIADFPWATVHISERMHANITPDVPFKWSARLRSRQWAHGPQWATHGTYAAEFLGLPSAELPFGGGSLHLVPLEGHLPGHLGVAVRRADGATPWLLHVGDAAFSARVFAGGSTGGLLGLYEAYARVDKRAWSATQRSLADLAQRHTAEVELVCSHDPATFPAPTLAT